MQKIIALLTLIIGFTLLIYMITFEDEPGALPLLMIIIGASWYFYVRAKKQNLN